MEPFDILVIVVLGVLAVKVILNSVTSTGSSPWPHATRWWRTKLSQRQAFPHNRIFNPTRRDLLFYLICWSTAITYDVLGVKDLSEASNRVAQIAIMDVFLLLLSPRLGIVYEDCTARCQTMSNIHVCIGTMAVVHAVVHCLLQLESFVGPLISDIVCISTMLAIYASALLLYLSYEVFLWAHRTLTMMLTLATVEHLRRIELRNWTIYCVLGGVFVCATGTDLALQIYRNIAWRPRGSLPRIARVESHIYGEIHNSSSAGGPVDSHELLLVEIKLPRRWKIQPAQYVWLTLLTTNYTSFLQRHPFTIIWWDDNNHSHSIYLMIEPKGGWTRRICTSHQILSNRVAWLRGPAGALYALEAYHTVLLFAEAHGIFAQLSLAKALIERTTSPGIRTRKILLIWKTIRLNAKLDEELKGWINSVLHDSCSILHIKHHRCRNNESEKVEEHTSGSRVTFTNAPLDVQRYVQSELGDGKIIATMVSGSRNLRAEVEAAVIRAASCDVQYFEHDFQPGS